MYIPVFKNRLFENKFIREQQVYFGDNIVPLIEILSLKIGRTKMSVDEMLSIYDDCFSSNYLIDYFTFDDGEYSKFDPNQVPFYFEHRNDKIKDYYDLLELVCQTKHGVPVISIKKGRDYLLNGSAIKMLIQNLQIKSPKIAIRIQSRLLQTFFKDIDPLLRDDDLLIYDINEDSIQSKFFDRKTISSKTNYYKVIVLNSPRSSKINNGSYHDGDYTGLIDNKIKVEYITLGFDGFGDYAGLKNVLPTDGSNGKGAALGLFYDNSVNQFFSIMNENSDLGTRGHLYVLEQAFEVHKQRLNPNNDCPAYNFMYDNLYCKNSPGQWGQWKYITILRYISQVKSSL